MAAGAPPTEARGSHSAALGCWGAPGGALAGGAPFPGAQPRLGALDGGCSRNKSKFLCAELGRGAGMEGP